MPGAGSRVSKLRSSHGDLLFAPPDGSTDWREEYERLELIIFPDMKVALRSHHGLYLSDCGDGSLVWNKEEVREEEVWVLQLVR